MEGMKENITKNDLNAIKSQIAVVKETIKNYCKSTDFNNKVKDIEDRLRKIVEVKSDKQTVQEKFQEFNERIKARDDDLIKYKEIIQNQFEAKQKIQDKIEKNIETKSDKEAIQEIKDLIRNLAHKESITELEKKVFPIMKDIINKVESFDEIIRENRSALYRVDELILDKASK